MSRLERQEEISAGNIVRGFKVFNPDWTCRGKQYTCPGKHEENINPSMCETGMHFCKKAIDCFKYYGFNPENKVAAVAAYGIVKEEGNKCCTDKLEIIREITWTELLEIVNSGHGCTGFGNSGDSNSGYRNSGDYNSGNYNSGDYNSGDYNNGDYNSGDYNSGDWNKCDFSNGVFNTISPRIYLFNKPSEWTFRDWMKSDACYLLYQIPKDVIEYIRFSDMTDEEKAAHPEAKTTGGYLKNIDSSESASIWWSELSEERKTIITKIPNFDKEIFKEITGIDVDESKQKVRRDR